MKNFFITLTLCLFISDLVYGQNVWTELNAVISDQPASEIPILRNAAAGFAIGNGIYYCTGNRADYRYDENLHDLWKYDVTNNKWSQKAQLTNTGRSGAYSFVINGVPYVLMGVNDTIYNQDLWKYDALSNAWSLMAPFPGVSRFSAANFCLNNKFYIGGGRDLSVKYNDFWEYDPAGNVWTRKNDLWKSIYYGQCFSTSSFGYVAAAFDSVSAINTTLRYDPLADAWDSVSVCPGQNLMGAFSVNDSGYVFSVWVMYKYEEASDTWITKDSMDVKFVSQPTISELNGKEYFITYDNDVWSYDPVSDSWDKLFNAPKGGVSENVLVLGDTAYFNLHKYSILDDTWISDSTFSDFRWALSIGSYGFGTNYLTGEFRKFNPQTYSFTTLTQLPFEHLVNAIQISGNGYFYGFNYDSLFYPIFEFWKYDPVLDTWTRCSDFPSTFNDGVAAFGLGDNGYFIGGMNMNGVACAQVYQYSAINNNWTALNDYPPGNIVGASATTFNGKGVLAYGAISQFDATLHEIYEYDPVSGNWSQIYNVLTARRVLGLFFSHENNIYLGSGLFRRSQGFEFPLFDFWKYTETPVGVEEIGSEENRHLIYPNPVVSELKIKDYIGQKAVKIYNVFGEFIKRDILPVDVSEFPNGIYLLKNEDGGFLGKFTVTH